LASTGVLQLFVYKPSISEAYLSVQHLQTNVTLGQLIRNIHHWSANFLVIIAFLHLLRVYLSGAYHEPRQFNWIIGLGLFFLVLCSNFTGYLLPWDQLAFWAVTICTSMFEYIPIVGTGMQKMIRGGTDVGSTTLSIFFAFHVAILPICFASLMPFHFWRVRKAGGVVKARLSDEVLPASENLVTTVPHLVIRELALALILIAFVLFFSIFVNAPLQDQANPGLSPNPTKAPWYFLGIQELLIHFHPTFAVLVIPVMIIVMVLLLPYLKYEEVNAGIWFASQKGRRMGLVAFFTAFLLTPTMIVLDEYFVDFGSWLPGVAPIISNGLLPFLVLTAILFGYYQLMKRKFAPTNLELIQSTFIFLTTAFLILTVTGVWFRGSGMKLTWPW
jgi:quinol-cytochrome oxidoreductase complex cytochrome b subunit